jgi:hypothetical protein
MDNEAKSIKSFDPRKDKLLDIPEDEDYINQSLNDFKPPLEEQHS